MTKLLYISNARIPTEKAHGRQVMKMCEAFARCDVNVELVVPYRHNILKMDPFEYYEVAPKAFRIKKLPSIDLVVLVKVGFWIQHLSFLIFAIPYAIFSQANIMYSRDIYLCFALSVLGARKVIFEDHEPLRNRRIYAFLLKHIAQKVIVAENLRTLYESLNVPLTSVLVAPNGVDIEEFDSVSIDKHIWNRKYGIPEDKKIILYTGHFYRWKGMYTLLDSSSFIKDNAVIVCIGGTEKDYAKVQSYIEEQKLLNVYLVPFIPHKEVLIHLKSADVLVLPNTAKEERSLLYTTPLKLFEYMASGVPIVASRISSFASYLKDGENAILFDPDDSEDLAYRIHEVISDTNCGINYADAARQTAENHTWMKRAESILSFFIR